MNTLSPVNRTDLIQRGTLCFMTILGMLSIGFLCLIIDFVPTDFLTYYHGINNVVQGKQFVGTSAPAPTGPYVYLPGTVVAFLPLAIMPKWSVAYPFMMIVNVVGGIVLANQTVKIIRSRGIALSSTDTVFVYAAVTFSVPGAVNVLQTQPNLWLAAAVLAGYRYIEMSNEFVGGALFAIPAIFKLWPAFFGLWLLHRREWKALSASIVSGVAALAGSVLLFGINTHIQYFHHILGERSWTDNFAGGLAVNKGVVTLRRPISIIFPNIDPNIMSLIGFVISGTLLLAIYYHTATTKKDGLLSLTATLGCVIIAFPSINPYMIFLIPLGIALLYTASQEYVFPLATAVLLISLTFSPEHFNAAINLLPLPQTLVSSIFDLVFSALTFTSIPLLGVTILLFTVFDLIKQDESVSAGSAIEL